MYLLELNKLKKAKISFENVPSLIVLNYKTLQNNIVKTTYSLNEDRTFIIELMLPDNACYYALLGAKYIHAANRKGLDLEVRYLDFSNENYLDTTAYSSKTVFKGLSKEYIEIVLNTAIEHLQLNTPPCGKIVFDIAACCEVGSSPKMFKIITKIVLDVLIGKQYPVSDKNIKKICEKYLKERC